MQQRIARESRREELVLREKIDVLKTLHESNPSNKTLNNLENAIADLDSYEEKKVEGIIVRFRARWHEHGEKSTKYFSNLEKRNHFLKHIRKLNLSGVITTNPFEILEAEKTYYKNLYSSKQLKVCSPEESGLIVVHENVYFSNGNYETKSSKLADENAKC